MSGGGVEGGQDCGQQESQPFEQASEVVSGGGEDGVGGVAVGSGEVIPKAVLADSLGGIPEIGAMLIQDGMEVSRHAISGPIARGLFG